MIDEVATWLRGAAADAGIVPYDERTRAGDLRYAIIREAETDVMVVLVVTSAAPRAKNTTPTAKIDNLFIVFMVLCSFIIHPEERLPHSLRLRRAARINATLTIAVYILAQQLAIRTPFNNHAPSNPLQTLYSVLHGLKTHPILE